jgi:poly(3-hydroxybutyrate) depolymerase
MSAAAAIAAVAATPATPATVSAVTAIATITATATATAATNYTGEINSTWQKSGELCVLELWQTHSECILCQYSLCLLLPCLSRRQPIRNHCRVLAK